MSTTGRRDTGREESTEDAPTVRADLDQLRRVLEDRDRDDAAEDARTVQVRRLPVAFIGESVFDPVTKVDARPAARRWRAEANVDEIILLAEPPSLDPPPHLVATPTPAPEVVLEDEPSLATMLLALVGGVALGAIVVSAVAVLVL